MNQEHFDVCILGAGPSGSAASMYLSQHGINHVIIDKSEFPRDKICGDALSGKVVYALNRVYPGLVQKMVDDHANYLPSWGITFVAPNGKKLEVPFKTNVDTTQQAPGFIAQRNDFDQFLFNHLVTKYSTILTSTQADKVDIGDDGVNISLSNNTKISASILIDGTGAHSSLAKQLGIRLEPEHHSAGLRQYYENVDGLSNQGFIELHFIKDILPGYFWIFPMTGNRANVGIGMLSSEVSKRKINLKKVMEDVIVNHPEISLRFKHATALEKPKGWGLPMGSKKRTISSNRLMLVGDAASLIDPFTGEGIGNGMISGKYAAEVAIKALKSQRFDAEFMSTYDQLVYAHLWPELVMSHQLQKMVKYPWLFNFVVNKGLKSKEFRSTLTAMFENVDLRKKFKDPMFYLRLLTNR